METDRHMEGFDTATMRSLTLLAACLLAPFGIIIAREKLNVTTPSSALLSKERRAEFYARTLAVRLGAHLGLLLTYAYTRTIGAAATRITIITRIVNAGLIIGALGSSDSTTGLGFRLRAFAWMIDGHARRGSAARIAIGFAIAAADRVKLSCTNRWLDLAVALRVGNLALTDTEITVLVMRAGQPTYGAANSC